VASQQGGAHFAQIASADGYAVSARATVSPNGSGAAAAVAQVRASHPQVLVVLDDAGAVGGVLKARAAAGWRVPVIAGPDATTTPVLAQIAGAERGVSVDVPDGAIAGTGPGAGGTFSFRKHLAAQLGGTIHGSIIPYAETFDAMTMLGNAATGAMSVVGTQITTFLENANYQGVLASYTYTAGAHTGVSASNQSVVALDSLSNGLLQPPPKPTKKAAGGL
jgi:ABC-type branched-subunit amino acid transport system substrate-binding protein